MAKQMICTDCGTIGKPKSDMKGSILTEFFLWCLFLLPGLIYTVWRFTTVGKACRACGSRSLIATDSPRGRALAQQFGGAAKMVPIVVLLALCATASATLAQESKPLSVTIPEGTQIRARLASQLDSGQVRIGDLVMMDVLEDVKIENAIAIPRGAIVMGHVSEAKGARKMGRGGRLDISFDTVTAGDGTKVPISGGRFAKGSGGYGGGSAAGAAAAGLFFPPAGALLLLKHGHASVIPVGTILTVRVTADTPVTGTRPGSEAIAAPAAAPAPVPSAERHLMVISGTDGAASQALGQQSDSLGDVARRYRAQKAAQQK